MGRDRGVRWGRDTDSELDERDSWVREKGGGRARLMG